MSERSERTTGAADWSVMPEPSVSEAQAMSERSERTTGAADWSVMPEPSVSEAQA
ncbi:hypothetical protein OG203_14055 [Nocardia sp. NBC_01499]|uniref:hypothetical protein n=1 Tax=Nocardia sp. NBC_01499 TaxID=2903597 RepID=UPI003870B3CF